ncbi:protein twisted gastrulation [Leptinotarsa decemlineata]|uniref:protein twisted gastrulation n=1 Tax=Leptinotarsa decemlineata TaxID=7539 RepID=UPI003D309515
MLKYIIPFVILVGGTLIISQVESCNEAVCGSVVSKCLLTKSCNCDLKNCTCCKDCFNCLSYLYTECCSCVDMCPKPNETSTTLSRKSHIEDFSEGVPALFSVLTELPDVLERWDTKTFPVDIEYTNYAPKKEIKIKMQSAEQEVVPIKQDVITLNCTVAFWAQCMSWTKCRTSCQSMGASSYRWFHDGCCECVGQYCINYGINEGRCRACSQGEGSQEEEPEEDDYDDYGEDDLDE